MTKTDIGFAKSDKYDSITIESAQLTSIHKNKDD